MQEEELNKFYDIIRSNKLTKQWTIFGRVEIFNSLKLIIPINNDTFSQRFNCSLIYYIYNKSNLCI